MDSVGGARAGFGWGSPDSATRPYGCRAAFVEVDFGEGGCVPGAHSRFARGPDSASPRPWRDVWVAAEANCSRHGRRKGGAFPASRGAFAEVTRPLGLVKVISHDHRPC